MVNKCQCRRRIRTNPDGTSSSTKIICKLCLEASEKTSNKIKAPEEFKSVIKTEMIPEVVDQKIESDMSVEAKVEVEKKPEVKRPRTRPYGYPKPTTSDIDEKGPKKA